MSFGETSFLHLYETIFNLSERALLYLAEFWKKKAKEINTLLWNNTYSPHLNTLSAGSTKLLTRIVYTKSALVAGPVR